MGTRASARRWSSTCPAGDAASGAARPRAAARRRTARCAAKCAARCVARCVARYAAWRTARAARSATRCAAAPARPHPRRNRAQRRHRNRPHPRRNRARRRRPSPRRRRPRAVRKEHVVSNRVEWLSRRKKGHLSNERARRARARGLAYILNHSPHSTTRGFRHVCSAAMVCGDASRRARGTCSGSARGTRGAPPDGRKIPSSSSAPILMRPALHRKFRDRSPRRDTRFD